MRRGKIDFFLVLLVIIACLPLKVFLHSGLPLTHDGQDHVARIANFYQSLSEGNLVPRWAANLNWGYGHPILMFLYPLPSYLASFWHFLGFSLINSVKIIFGLSFILSGIFMYLWLKEIWGKEAGFTGALIYLLAPYRFVDLFVRGAIGECWAFVWPPLALYFALRLSRTFEYRYLIGSSLALAALILSHNALSLMFLILIFGYLGYLIYISKNKRRLIANFVLLIALGFGLSAFFWFPALMEGKYTLRNIVTKNNFTGFESFSRLLWSSWSFGGTGSFSVQLGLVQWLAVVLSPLAVWKLRQKKNNNWLFLLVGFLLFWLAILMILPLSQPVYEKMVLLQKFQFAWRWLSLAIFLPSLFIGAVIFLQPKRLKLPAVIIITAVSLFFTKDFWQAKNFLHQPDSFFLASYAGTTDTGESAPRWSVRFMEQWPTNKIAVIDGKAEIQERKRKTNYHEYQLAVFESARLVENTLYFPGWQVLVDGQPIAIEFQDPAYRGLITFMVNEGSHRLILIFRETKLRLLADWISGLSLVSLIGISLLKCKYR